MLVIFDCDGVLVDTEEVSCRVFTDALVREGVHWSIEQTMTRLMGRSVAACIEIVETDAGRRLPADFALRLQDDTFEAFRRAPVGPVPGIEQALAALQLQEVPFCVASSGKVEKMRLTLGLARLWPYFVGRVFSATMVSRGKPFPDLFLHAAQQMGQEPSKCIVVEDAVPGVQAGKAAGMRVLAFAGAAWADRAALQAAGGELFESMADLLGLLGR